LYNNNNNINTQTFKHSDTHTYTQTHTHAQTHVHTTKHTFTHPHMHTYIHINTHTQAHIHIKIHTYTRTHVHTHTPIYTHTSHIRTCKQSMKFFTSSFTSGGLHEKHVVANFNLGNLLSICFQTHGNQEKPLSGWPFAGRSKY